MDVINTLLGDTGNTEIQDELMKNFYEKRVLLISDEISDWILEDIILHILKFNMEDKDIPIEKRRPIYLYIDSEGGNVFDANNLIDVINASSTPIYSVGFGLIASAALLIYISCDKRYCFKHSIFNMHEGKSGVYDHSNKARDFMGFLDRIDDIDKHRIIDNTKITEEEFEEHKRIEQFFFADEAREKGMVDLIIGEDIAIDEIL